MKNTKKRALRALCVCLALLTLAASLSACGKRLVQEGTRLTDRQNHVSYTDISGVYMAKSVSSDVYATFKLNGVKKTFYAIEGMDPLEWLVSQYGELFYSGSDTLPGLTGFVPDNILVCTNADIPMTLYEIDDGTRIAMIVAAFEHGENTEIPDGVQAEYYAVRFSSPLYPSLYYALKLAVTDDAVYMFSRYDGICVNMGDLFDGYIPDYFVDEEDY